MVFNTCRTPSVQAPCCQNPCTYSWFQIDQYSTRNISCVVGLVEENVLSISALGSKVFQITVLTDSMLLAKLLPELTPNYSSSVSVSIGVSSWGAHRCCRIGQPGWLLFLCSMGQPCGMSRQQCRGCRTWA